jgi:hypothetical protein
MDRIEIECALSPDYLQLLRSGKRWLEPVVDGSVHGCRAGDVTIWVAPTPSMSYTTPYQDCCGHATVLRLLGSEPKISFDLGVTRADTVSEGQAETSAKVLEVV